MKKSLQIKEQFLTDKNQIMNSPELLGNAFKFCIRYSLLVEEYIYRILSGKKFKLVIASAGILSRREIAPYSEIDLMIICEKIDGNEAAIKKSVTKLWDCGIEVSHTVRQFSDIKKFVGEDLHAFTQFFETRYMLGDKNTYAAWNRQLFKILEKKDKARLLKDFFEDIEVRYIKYGDSPKVLEPNVKFSAGGLRDIHAVEWMCAIKNNMLLAEQSEQTQTEIFLKYLKKNKVVNPKETTRIKDSYNLVLSSRIVLHILSNRNNDRLEFTDQEKISELLHYGTDGWQKYMQDFFQATSNINRFSRTMMKRFERLITEPLSDYLAIDLDDDFILKGNQVILREDKLLSFSEMMRAFYYRGLHGAIFEENLRSNIIESVAELEEAVAEEAESSVFFREILKLPQNVGKTLQVMNELGFLGVYLPQFRPLIGFFQPGVYHCYTADEHTLIALRNVEKLYDNDGKLGNIFNSLVQKDLLYLAVIFHDIAKPIAISGHAILGAELVSSVMDKLGYEMREIQLVQFLVRHHLTMEQVAFRRNLNDPVTLDNFAALFQSTLELDMLYLLTYADLSAVSPVVWTNWKSDLLYDLYTKIKGMLLERLSGQDILFSNTVELLQEIDDEADASVRSHVESINDASYVSHYSQEEINEHVAEIERGSRIGVFFKNSELYTNITIITRDFDSLLSRLCGAMAINDLNILDARIFTRQDGIVIDSFNVTNFNSHKPIDPERNAGISESLKTSIDDELFINREFDKMKSRWWRIENKLFKRKGKVTIEFEKHEKYTIVDIFSPDRLGLLYRITQKMNELGISIYTAKIATRSDDVVDAFYVLDRNGNKVKSVDYDLIKLELTEAITEIL